MCDFPTIDRSFPSIPTGLADPRIRAESCGLFCDDCPLKPWISEPKPRNCQAILDLLPKLGLNAATNPAVG